MTFADGFAMKAGMIAADIAVGFATVFGFFALMFLLYAYLSIKSRKR